MIAAHYISDPRTIAGAVWRLVVVDSRCMPGSRTVEAQFCRAGLWRPGTTVAGSCDDTAGAYGLPAAVATAFRRSMPEIERLLQRVPEIQGELGSIHADLARDELARREVACARRAAEYEKQDALRVAEFEKRARGEDLPMFASA